MKRVTVLVAAIAMAAMGTGCADRGASAIAPQEPTSIVITPAPQLPAPTEAFEDTEVYGGSTMDR